MTLFDCHFAEMRIHMSPFSKAALEKYKGFYLADRGKIPVKVSVTEST